MLNKYSLFIVIYGWQKVQHIFIGNYFELFELFSIYVYLICMCNNPFLCLFMVNEINREYLFSIYNRFVNNSKWVKISINLLFTKTYEINKMHEYSGNIT
jgi:hypothetical protein